jgi:hypothetical protein
MIEYFKKSIAAPRDDIEFYLQRRVVEIPSATPALLNFLMMHRIIVLR